MEAGGSRCTAARVKSCMKLFFAQLFSHVGLCALVVGYAIMGAFIFAYLEKDNELSTRANVKNLKRQTLNELYNITGRIKYCAVVSTAIALLYVHYCKCVGLRLILNPYLSSAMKWLMNNFLFGKSRKLHGLFYFRAGG